MTNFERRSRPKRGRRRTMSNKYDTFFYVSWLAKLYEVVGEPMEKALNTCTDGLRNAMLEAQALSGELAGNDELMSLAFKAEKESLAPVDIQKVVVAIFNATMNIFRREYPNVKVTVNIKKGEFTYEYRYFFDACSQSKDCDRARMKRLIQDGILWSFLDAEGKYYKMREDTLAKMLMNSTDEEIATLYWAYNAHLPFVYLDSISWGDMSFDLKDMSAIYVLLRTPDGCSPGRAKALACRMTSDKRLPKEEFAKRIAMMMRQRKEIHPDHAAWLVNLAGMCGKYNDAAPEEQELVLFEAANKLGVAIL